MLRKALSTISHSWLFLVAGCGKKPAAGGPPPNPPTSVLAAEAKKQSVGETLSVVGTLTANESIEVKAETDGTVVEILFQENDVVAINKAIAILETETGLPAETLAKAGGSTKEAEVETHAHR